MARFLIFALFILLSITIRAQQATDTPRRGEGISTFLERNGRPGRTYQQEFFDLVETLEKRLEYAKNNTSLPKEPNFKQLNEFVMECNKKFWNIN